jgi:hypothetical protein
VTGIVGDRHLHESSRRISPGPALFPRQDAGCAVPTVAQHHADRVGTGLEETRDVVGAVHHLLGVVGQCGRKHIVGNLPTVNVQLTPAQARQRDRGSVSKQIQKHFTACGIRTIKPGTGQGTGTRAVVEVGFHSLRHTFVSLCREANAPLVVVEAIVGHANSAMTRHYTHICEAAAALPDVTGAAEPVLPAGETVTIPVATLR